MEVKYPLKVSTIQYKCPKCGNFMVGQTKPFHTEKFRHFCSGCEHLEFLDTQYPYIHYDMVMQEEGYNGGYVSISFNQNP